MNDNNFLQNLIDQPQNIANLRFEDISKILKEAQSIFNEEELLLEFKLLDKNEEVYVIGDIHGNLHSLLNILEIIKKNRPKYIIFLGDIVDRGIRQLECLIIILALKILNPNRVFLLKGNHETLEMNQYYGFFQEFVQKFNDQKRFKDILEVYNVLPFCAVINNKVLCLHGGIPEDKEILKKLKGLKHQNINSAFKSVAEGLYQIIWNDPKEGLNGFSESFRGPGIKFFGEDVFNNFLKSNNLKYLIRAHECFPEGYRWFFNNHLLSVFSSANYRGAYSPNPASYAIVRNDKIIPINIELS
ncbi:MAG: metallophosphoesterase [Candidatus Hodarchaeota archaeon]